MFRLLLIVFLVLAALPATATFELEDPAKKIMEEKNIIRLPITEDGKLVGIVARCDILATLIEPEFATYM